MSDTNDGSCPSDDWRSWLTKSTALPPDATTAEKATRGREFERALAGMFEEDDLAPRTSFRPTGEEVDGSLWLDGRTYLFEAKWTSKPHPASSLYQFKGKVDGKLSGTIGLFFSMSGYSGDAVEALKVGKEINLVLFDRSDVRLVADKELGIAEAIRLKLRAAAESGTPSLNLEDFLSARKPTDSSAPLTTYVFVEGSVDRTVLNSVRLDRQATLPVEFFTTGGPRNMASTIDAISRVARKPISIVAILESDQLGTQAARDVEDIVAQINAENGSAKLVWIPGTLEDCLGLYETDRRPRRINPAQIQLRLAQLDLDERVRLHPGLVPVLDAVGVQV